MTKLTCGAKKHRREQRDHSTKHYLMDEIVKQSLTKWPNVPHCYGWLALDARGAFRMRDETAQATNHLGDIIRHESLLAFIYRNYDCDSRGAWYFQNGPQRVYVELESTPFIARTDPELGFVLHDRTPVHEIDQAFLTNTGQLIIQSHQKIAMVDLHDLAQCLAMLYVRDEAIADNDLLNWLSAPNQPLQIKLGKQLKNVEWVASNQLENRFSFIAHPSKLENKNKPSSIDA
jgi:hypothetical protein